MISKTALILATILAMSVVQPGHARRDDPRRDDQGVARQDMASGKVKRLREIEAGVVPRMRGMQYLGPEYDSVAQVYRLKFIDKGRVIFVDVDARTGGILRQR